MNVAGVFLARGPHVTHPYSYIQAHVYNWEAFLTEGTEHN